MTLGFFSNLVDGLQRLLRDADLSFPTFEQLRSQNKRSEELLFIYLSEDNAYLLDILKHEKADGSVVTWTKTDLIQIIHDNWPHLIKSFIYKTNSNTNFIYRAMKALPKNAGNTHVVLHPT